MSNVISDPSRQFLVGETVHLEVRVSKPGTKTPTDPDAVTLITLKRDGTNVTIPSGGTFTREAAGDYIFTLPTASFSPGTYSLMVRVNTGSSKVVLIPDTFVLVAVP